MNETRWLSLFRFAAIAATACVMQAAWAQAPASQASSAMTAASPAPGESPDVTAIRKLLLQKFPGAEISHIAKSGYLGLYEVMLGDQLIYTDPKVTYVFVGSIYDTATKTNLTEARSRKLNRVAVDKLPLDLAFKRVKGDGSRTIYLFSDADCPFCHRLEKEMQGLDNVTVYTFLFPIDQLHPDAARKSKILWCAPDRAKAWDAYFATGRLPDNKGDCGDPVAKTQALGASLHINATPTLIFADGTIIPGALPLPQLEKELASAQADLKKNGTQGK
ncbi:MAG TPA: DsbC family protein [Casimicrobiaceae bacterium]|nr:DsbC family protein [Casimicrobiaceae bacterium]